MGLLSHGRAVNAACDTVPELQSYHVLLTGLGQTSLDICGHSVLVRMLTGNRVPWDVYWL